MGIIGMIIAVITTLFNPNVLSYEMIILGILIGGAIGTYIALNRDSGLPQLVNISLISWLSGSFLPLVLFSQKVMELLMIMEKFFSSLVKCRWGGNGAITFTGSIIAHF